MRIPPVQLELESDPIFFKRRILPYDQREIVKYVIEKMQKDGIISRVSSTNWATPIVVTMKADSKSPRICGDYRVELNPKLKISASTTDEPEDFIKSLDDSTIFSKIDLSNVYLQTPLQDTSKPVTTVNTPWGLIQFNFLPFGLHVSSSIFQSAIDEIIKGLKGVKANQDDAIVYASNEIEHDERLKALLVKFRDKNVTLKPEKRVFRVNELSYLGLIVRKSGYCPDHDRLKPLTGANSPKNQDELRSIMGCLQYYSRFIPNFASRAQPLFALQTNEKWNWTNIHESVLRSINRQIAGYLPIN